MPWILLLLSLASFALAFVTTSVWLAWLALLAALALVVAGVLVLADRRIAARSRDVGTILDADLLRRYRSAQDARGGREDASGRSRTEP
ncbi:hypothetical protein [Coralloluteibacterium stylophorae]|uniref:Uncharacterized protein n=1 Tax=Coralloluteibacterium stylophorae TaxID=1776034 RepID=A0A8J7VUG5_9GAMM|nr:hypothetical protein [Coralloluteibacterium stylophorae]MBS7458943.1 hypothetical protein [Coralloluteibacterium stylophorae]